MLRTLVRVVPGSVTVEGAVPADPKDDKIVAAAIEACASYIVSQDRHLLDLRSYGSIAMVSIEQLNTELDRLGVS